jgi:uncharacterized protein (TIGR02246 family)
MAEAKPEDVVLAFVERINARDADGLAELMTEGFTFVDYAGGVEVGRDVMREGFAEYFRCFPEYKIHVDKVLRSGNDVAIVGTTTGSHVGPEAEADETVLWVAEVEGARVASWRIYVAETFRTGGK